MATYEVRAQKTCLANFTITASTRKEAEAVIEDKLHSDKEIIWTDDPEGISIACIPENTIWRIRRRFHLGE